MRFKFVFCSKRMKTIQAKKSKLFFDFIPLNNADIFFLLQDNGIVALCHLE